MFCSCSCRSFGAETNFSFPIVKYAANVIFYAFATKRNDAMTIDICLFDCFDRPMSSLIIFCYIAQYANACSVRAFTQYTNSDFV